MNWSGSSWAAIDGLHVPAGTVVVLPLGAANRDPEQLPEPHALRPTNRHVSFAPGERGMSGQQSLRTLSVS